MVVDACVGLSSPKEGISVPHTLGKCNLRYYSLNDGGSVTKASLQSARKVNISLRDYVIIMGHVSASVQYNMQELE